MRKTQYLINEARTNTNTTDSDAITNALCVSFLNRVQEFIFAYLFTQNIESKLFRKQYTFTTTNGTDTYALPFDVYAKNSINNIMYKNGNVYSPMKQIAEKARGLTSGYFLSDSNIIFTPIPSFPMELSVSYTRRLPTLGISYGTVKTVTENTKITLDTGYSTLTGVDDYFTVVNSLGEVIKHGLIINQSSADLLLSDTSDILVGMLVVPGFYSTTVSQLPDELESSLIMGLETFIDARLSSKDIKITKPLSDEMLAQIGSMFAENTTDIFMPPVVEYSEWV